MGVTVLCGRAGSGKTARLAEGVRASLAAGRRVIYLVPQQASYNAEKSLIEALHAPGLWGVEVMSPLRLCQKVLEHHGAGGKTLIDNQGRRIMLCRAARCMEHSLGVWARAAQRPAFADPAVRTLRMMKAHGQTLADMRGAVDKLPEGLLRSRMADLCLLRQGLEKEFGPGRFDAEDAVDLAIEAIRESAIFDTTDIYIDEWDAATPQMLRLLAALFGAARQVVMSICLAPPPCQDPAPFMAGQALYAAIARMAGEGNIPLTRIDVPSQARAVPDALDYMEKHLFADAPAPYTGDASPVSLLLYSSPEEEARGIAHALLQAHRSGIKWREMAIVCPQIASWAPRLRRALDEFSIPYFLDDMRDATMAPPTKGLLALLDAAAHGFPADGVFDAMKCGLWPLSDVEAMMGPLDGPDFDAAWMAAVEAMERYCLHNGIRGLSMWKREWLRNPGGRYDLAYLNTLRAAFVPAMEAIQQLEGKTALEVCAQLGRLVEGELPQAEAMAGRMARQHGLDGAALLRLGQECLGALPAAQSALRQLGELMGDVALSLADTAAMLRAGLTGTRLGVIPPTTDQVTVGALGYSILPRVQAVYLIGATESAMAGAPREGLFGDDDIERLRQEADFIAAPSSQALAEQADHTLYRVLSCAGSRLTVSMSASGSTGGAERPSAIMTLLSRLFGKPFAKAQAPVGASCPGQASYALAQALAGGEDSAQAAVLAQWMRRQQPVQFARLCATLKRIGQGEGKLSPQAARALIDGDTLSPTQLERFAACPLRHAMDFGLRPTPDLTARPPAERVGTLLHAAIEGYVSGLDMRHMPLEPGEEDIAFCMNRAIEQLEPQLTQTGEGRQAARRMQHALMGAARAALMQLRLGRFTPAVLEARFGPGERFAALPLKTGAGNFCVAGRIDRVDVLPTPQGDVLRVVDYKTGTSGFGAEGVEKGTQLQMVLYMAAMLGAWPARFGRPAIPAAMVHFPLADRLREREDTPLERMWRFQGVLSAREELLTAMDETLSPGEASNIIPVRLNKDGSPDKSSAVLPQEELGALIERGVAVAGGLAERMLAGEASYAKEQQACTYCPYRAACPRRGGEGAL
nr:PD-(D/E)XK nuclease family protein [bacterium]